MSPLTKLTSSSRSTQIKDILPWKISNDHEDHPNQHKNSHMQCDEIGHPVLGFCLFYHFTYFFSSRTNLKLHNISVTLKMVKKVITSLDLSIVSVCDFVSVVVLKNCELEFSYILPKLFNMYLKKFQFPDCCKVSFVVPVIKNVREMSTATNYDPVNHMSVVSEVFEKLAYNSSVDHLGKCDLFLRYSIWF